MAVKSLATPQPRDSYAAFILALAEPLVIRAEVKGQWHLLPLVRAFGPKVLNLFSVESTFTGWCDG
jgi:hypothetical protein